MSQVTTSPATAAFKASVRPERRDIGLRRRYASERRFRLYGLAAIAFGLLFLFLLLSSVVSKGYTAFLQTKISIPVEFSEQVIDKDGEVWSCRTAKRHREGYLGNVLRGDVSLNTQPASCPWTICPCTVPPNRGMIEGIGPGALEAEG